jgi:hypothetical protein
MRPTREYDGLSRKVPQTRIGRNAGDYWRSPRFSVPVRRPTWKMPRRSDLANSHSIINETLKPLIRRALAAASQILAVILTVNLSDTSTGAGFRAVRPKVTFEIYRHLSTPTTTANAGDHERSLRPDHRLADSSGNLRLFSAADVLGRDLAYVVMFRGL